MEAQKLSIHQSRQRQVIKGVHQDLVDLLVVFVFAFNTS